MIPAMKPDKKYTGEVRLSPDVLASINCTVLHTAAVLANSQQLTVVM